MPRSAMRLARLGLCLAFKTLLICLVVAFPAWVVAVLAAAAILPGAAWQAVGRGLPAGLAPAPRPTPPPETALTP